MDLQYFELNPLPTLTKSDNVFDMASERRRHQHFFVENSNIYLTDKANLLLRDDVIASESRNMHPYVSSKAFYGCGMLKHLK